MMMYIERMPQYHHNQLYSNISLYRGNSYDSISTEQEISSPFINSKNIRPFKQKQKSQLCRKFMEYGFCPYKNKCKFAHGSHQLRNNSEMNLRYKTKQCGTFFKNGFCQYGDRCNFLHRKKNRQPVDAEIMKNNFRDLFEEIRQQSRMVKHFNSY